VGWLHGADSRDPSVTSERLGEYAYTASAGEVAHLIPAGALRLLARYRDLRTGR